MAEESDGTDIVGAGKPALRGRFTANVGCYCLSVSGRRGNRNQAAPVKLMEMRKPPVNPACAATIRYQGERDWGMVFRW